MDKLFELAISLLKKNWKSILGLLSGILIIIIIGFPLNIPFKPYVILSLSVIWILLWIIKSGRFVFPTSKYLIAFCIKADDKARVHYKKVFDKLQKELDTFNLSKSIKILNISPDIVSNRKQAEKYRETQNVDLVVWGNAHSETHNGKDIVNFALSYTFRLNEALRAKMTLFSLDFTLVVGTRDWTIKLDNTLFEEVKVVHNFVGGCLFMIGIHLLTDNKLRDAIEVLNTLRLMIDNMREDDFKKFIRGRINSLIVDTYFLLGKVENERGNYKHAKQYFMELEKFVFNKFHTYVQLARLEYLLGSLANAKKYTKKALKIDKHHPVIYLNRAFFRILEKKYDSALFWYKKLITLKLANVDFAALLEFLHDRYTENKKELAYLFAMGFINYRFFDRENGVLDLSNFIKRAKSKKDYFSMVKYAEDLVAAEKYRKKS